MATNEISDSRRAETFPRPALDVLDSDQDQIRSDLLDGFDGYRSVIGWWQRSAVRTFGHIADEFPAEGLLNATRMRFLTESSRIAESRRSKIYTEEIAPACQDAFNDLKTQAVERLSAGEGEDTYADLDVEAQQDPAMRPAFRILEARQQRALRRLWGGFESDRELSEWLHELTSCTYGQIDREAASDLSEGVTRSHMLDPGSTDAQRYRVLLAIGELLPAFAAAARRLQAGESATDDDEKGAFPNRG
jgi:hypothetical protein